MLTLPLVSGNDRTVNTNIDGDSYSFRTVWHERPQYYTLDITHNGVEVALGVPLVTGSDILRNYVDLPLKNVFVLHRGGVSEPINFDDLGDDVSVIVFEESDFGG